METHETRKRARGLKGGGGAAPHLRGPARPFRMTRQKRHKMFFHADRTHAGAAPAMRDAKGLVKVEMADVSAISSRLRQPDLRVEIGAVEIDLSAMGMNDSANFANFGFEHAMRGWISDHNCGETTRI